MGRWSYSDRLTTDECKSVTTKFLNKKNYFNGGICSGQLNWTSNGEKAGSIGIWVSTYPDDSYIRFIYTHTNGVTGEKAELDYNAKIISTPCNYGGVRWWFICPAVKNEVACNQRVTALFLGGGKYFACRHCYNLTYLSCKENHRFDRLYLKMGWDPKTIKDLF